MPGRKLAADFDTLTDGSFAGAVANAAAADALVVLAATLDAFAPGDLTRAAVFDPRAAILETRTDEGAPLSLEDRTFALESFAATDLALSAPLFALGAHFVALAPELLAHAACLFGFTRALDGFAGATLGDGLCTRLRGKNQERKSRKQRGKLGLAEHVLSLLASFDAAGHRLFSADAHLTVASDCHAPAPAYV